LSDVLLRFRDLKDRKIVQNHPTLKRWIEREGFPPGFLLGPNSRAWREEDVTAWLDSRPTNPSPAALVRAEASNAARKERARSEHPDNAGFKGGRS
jgi:predicted DNA-binding transcriptional regulator AlpA